FSTSILKLRCCMKEICHLSTLICVDAFTPGRGKRDGSFGTEDLLGTESTLNRISMACPMYGKPLELFIRLLPVAKEHRSGVRKRTGVKAHCVWRKRFSTPVSFFFGETYTM